MGQCAQAAVAQAQNQYRGGYNGYQQPYQYGQGYGQGFAAPAMRVTAITQVERRSYGLRVRGLIDSGYTLGLRPGDGQLGIYSWASHDYRTQKRIAFEPKPNVWYRLKLRVEQQDGKALVQGKCWLRDQTEPEEWQLEMTDASPQKSGSPGLFGNTQTTSFYVDNLSVVAND